MAIFTKAEFKSLAQRGVGLEALTENRHFSKASATTSIFLSHAHDERELIAQALAFFENLNISIYVDWADETMPEKTSGVTAQKIKQQIVSNDKFILLATNGAVASKWCNWEVGIGDSFKLPNNNIALLPLADNNGTWNGNEYLQIYPRIENIASTYYVIYPDKSSELITDWIKRK